MADATGRNDGRNQYAGARGNNTSRDGKGGQNRKHIRPGLTVDIVLKRDQRTGKLTRGVVKDILTNSPTHPHGIKVRLQDGQVGRVQAIISTP